jgi:hypothetical protein
MKTFEIPAEAIGDCTIMIEANSKAEAIKKLKEGYWNSCELDDWEVQDFDLNDLSEVE